MPGPNLESIDINSAVGTKYDGLIGNVIYKATKESFQDYQKALGKRENKLEDNSASCRGLNLILNRLKLRLTL